MTNDEAINTLKNAAWLGWAEQEEKVSEAVRMAVEALKAQLSKEDATPDTISRQAAIEALFELYEYQRDIDPTEAADLVRQGIYLAEKKIEQLSSAQPEHICVNCGRTANNGGWYADGRTRCPIEEHYALPKDGYCHLWEKRNVTDDDYPERREE